MLVGLVISLQLHSGFFFSQLLERKAQVEQWLKIQVEVIGTVSYSLFNRKRTKEFIYLFFLSTNQGIYSCALTIFYIPFLSYVQYFGIDDLGSIIADAFSC